MESAVVLVTTSVPVRDAVERVLRTRTPVRHELSAITGCLAAKSASSVVICTLDVDWRTLISLLNADGEPGPPVILLLPAPDGRLWADALVAGAFDAIVMTEGPDRLLGSIAKAQARWERAQLVRDALGRNVTRHNAA